MEHLLKGRGQVFSDQSGPGLGLGNGWKSSLGVSGEVVQGHWSGVSAVGSAGWLASSRATCALCVSQEGISWMFPKPDLAEERSDHRLSCGFQIQHFKLGDLGDLRVGVTI